MRSAVLVPTVDVVRRGIEDHRQPQRDGGSTLLWLQQSSLACGLAAALEHGQLQQPVTSCPGEVGSSSTGSEPVVRDCASARAIT